MPRPTKHHAVAAGSILKQKEPTKHHAVAAGSILKQKSQKPNSRRVRVPDKGHKTETRISIPKQDECRGPHLWPWAKNQQDRRIHGEWEYTHMCAREPCPGTSSGTKGRVAWAPPGKGNVACTWDHFSLEESSWLQDCGVKTPTWELYLSMGLEPSTPEEDEGKGAEMLPEPFTPEEIEGEPHTPEFW